LSFLNKKDNDNIIEVDSFKVLIDPKSSIYLKGVVLNYQDGLNGKGFVFENPNAKNTCGCGESFSV
jgi:iron-sulfur cluster assembly protein